MGINPTPTNHRSFTFDGKSTREFGVYTTGKDVFNSPERAVEMISIPGRDGEYALDQGNFKNIEVNYRAGIVTDSTTDFAEAISNFRNWLASRKGYCRLTDEYNTEEYRMAVFKNAIALEHEGLLTDEFDVTFDCKPQRYLAIGEELTEIGAWGNTETAEGEIVTIDASSDTAVKALTVDIVPVQSGSGTPSPDNVRPISGHDEVGVSVNGINQWDEEWEVGDVERITGQNNPTANAIRSTGYIPVVPNTTYYAKCPSANQIRVLCYDANKAYIYIQPDGLLGDYSNSTFTVPNNCRFIRITTRSNYGTTYNNDISINYPSTDHEYHAYVGTTHTTTLPSTTYGGTLDVVSGVLTVTHVFKEFDGTNNVNPWKKSGSALNGFYTDMVANMGELAMYGSGAGGGRPVLSNKFKYTSNVSTYFNNYGYVYTDYTIGFNVDPALCGNTVASFQTWLASNPIQVVYELATPQTYQLTGQQIELLLGENNIFADSGNVTVEYGHNPTLLTNPTWFPSKPLLAVEGYGEVKFNNRSIVELDPGFIGEVTLLDGTTADEITFDESALNVSDTITVNGNFLFYIVMTNTSSVSYNAKRVSDSITDSNSDFSSAFEAENVTPSTSRFNYRTSFSFDITSGTDSVTTDTVSGTISCTTQNSATFTVTFSTKLNYTYTASTHKIKFSLTNSSVSTTASYIEDPYVARSTPNFTSVVGDSTKSRLGNPTYIDCDIGEAYMETGGSIVSLNQYIDLGSDLPTLPTGDTEVTYDNTITKVEVKPNWWKV